MFWFKFTGVLLIFNVVTMKAYDFEDLDEEDDENNYYENYKHAENKYDEPTMNKYDEFAVRVRRFQNQSPISTLSPEEIRGALKQILSNADFTIPFTPLTTLANDIKEETSSTSTDSETLLTISQDASSPDLTTYITNIFTQLYNKYLTHTPSRTPEQLEVSQTSVEQFRNQLLSSLHGLREKPTTSIILRQNEGDINAATPPAPVPTVATPVGTTTSTTVTAKRRTTTTTRTTTSHICTTTTSKPTRTPQLDIPRLLEIIADLASEFETNLTRKLNETLVQMSIPTCTTPTTEPPVTSEYDSNYTGATIAKCFVCGLETHGIPFNSHCADAFAGDFLPLVPVDPTAKGMISSFRKYCKYSNIPRYQYEPKHPRAVYGRWSGGCAVRWVDVSGVYTQRTCRNRMFPTVGKHYASKRMAKLERSLWNLEDGCITSPMATLVPLSRAVSLYARFHACVCSGSWCNMARRSTPLSLVVLFMLCILVSV